MLLVFINKHHGTVWLTENIRATDEMVSHMSYFQTHSAVNPLHILGSYSFSMQGK